MKSNELKTLVKTEDHADRIIFDTSRRCYFDNRTGKLLSRKEAEYLFSLRDHFGKHADRLIDMAITGETAPQTSPPRYAEFVVCLFVEAAKQEDRLADFEELFRTLWLPRFGPRVAKLIYIAQALRSIGAIIKISVWSAIVNGVVRAIGR